MQLKLSAKFYHQRYLSTHADYLKQVRSGKNAEFAMQPLGKKTFQTIKGAVGSGLKALRRKVRGPKGQTTGTYTTNAFEIDNILIDAWKRVDQGSATDHDALVKEFEAKYGKHIYRRKGGTFHVDPLRGADVKATCKDAKFSAGGLDQWSTQDFAILSDAAYDWLASMYNEILKGL